MNWISCLIMGIDQLGNLSIKILAFSGNFVDKAKYKGEIDL